MAQDATLSLSEPPAAHRLRVRATYASLAVAAVLIAAKLVVWISTDSVALLSSLVDSFVDAAASLVNFFAVRQAIVPADREHRFGHGKAEPLAALGQSAFLIGSAILLMFEAVRRLVSPAPVEGAAAGIAVMVFAIAVTLGLVAYQRHVIRHTGSIAVGADELHYRSDLILNLGVIATLMLGSTLHLPILDPLFGGAVGLWIIYGAVRIARLSLVQLMDREMPDTERARVRAIAEGHPEVTAVHDIRTRIAGPTTFIQLHIEMDGGMNLLRAHEISDAVEAQIQAAFPQAEILIHEDPAGIEERVAFPPRTAARS
ncbi:MAG: cation diffusion facilitator family transporter [Alphaproteobacteria bacterium]|jgi:ferrous-iron efflux pump FieF|nr:MAG: cation diffusion facilitator family transporter [Alphaproteobacteria bacterium]